MRYSDTHDGQHMKKHLSDTPEEAYEEAQDMGMDEVHSHEVDGELMFAPGENHEELQEELGAPERNDREKYPGSISSLGESDGVLDGLAQGDDTDDMLGMEEDDKGGLY